MSGRTDRQADRHDEVNSWFFPNLQKEQKRGGGRGTQSQT
jgi:hypothetical protein